MLTLKRRTNSSSQNGFTLVELLVVISVVVILYVAFSTFFTNYLGLYFGLQQDGSNFTELASQSERISDVLRGLTDIVSESSTSLTAYAYFSPSDTYVSLIHYYLNAQGTELLADVTPLTADPPNGTPITNSEKTFTILTNYYQVNGVSLFTYYDSSGDVLTPPVADEHTIIEIGVNLAEQGIHKQNSQQLNVIVSLRNRKTNL